MTDVDRGARYTAFLSYSHKDAAVARWLHRKLETYRIPKRLVGTQGERGPVPARLTPIFRDREELPAAGDLSEKVRAALAASDNLIVICSPHSAASPWVAKEIATFRALHPDRPVLAAITEADPPQCFPDDLAQGEIEPLGADLRKTGDGRRLGLLKLVAGLAGVGLDTLVQRDASRRVRRISYLTAVAVAAMLLMSFLAVYALNARTEAWRQREQAEGLVEFMLTDLRKELRAVGSLQVLTSANQRALAYYQQQDLEDLPAESLEQRARLLHLMGEDDLDRKMPDRALAQFREAARTTATLLAEEPRDVRRIYAHSQSEFWVGRVDYDRGNYPEARLAFRRYKRMADQLVATSPRNADWLKEAGFAEGNLCSIALKPPLDVRSASHHCAAALARMEAAEAVMGARSLDDELQNRHGWMADAWKAAGDLARARRERQIQESILTRMLASQPTNRDFKVKWILFQIAMADLYLLDRSPSWSPRQLDEASVELGAMIARDPQNKSLVQRQADLNKRINRIRLINLGGKDG